MRGAGMMWGVIGEIFFGVNGGGRHWGWCMPHCVHIGMRGWGQGSSWCRYWRCRLSNGPYIGLSRVGHHFLQGTLHHLRALTDRRSRSQKIDESVLWRRTVWVLVLRLWSTEVMLMGRGCHESEGMIRSVEVGRGGFVFAWQSHSFPRKSCRLCVLVKRSCSGHWTPSLRIIYRASWKGWESKLFFCDAFMVF